MLTFLPRPVLVNLGGRATKSAEIGLLGFTDEYSFVFEGSVVVLLTDKFMLAAEYKQQPAGFTPVPGLIGTPGDWWTIDAGYVINPHMTVAVGYGHFGTVANHTANTRLGHHHEVGVLRITGTTATKRINYENNQEYWTGKRAGGLWRSGRRLVGTGDGGANPHRRFPILHGPGQARGHRGGHARG